jgi:8-oxo-dGTP pyrophosphatase MutT (NUDIX family)
MPKKKINKFKFKKKAGGILKHKNRLLLVQSRGNKWGFPKGSLELNESVLDCALREVQEETSLLIPFTEDDKKYYFNDVVFFYKNLEGAPPIDHQKIRKVKNNDCSGIAWIDLECLERISPCDEPCTERGHELLCDDYIHNIKINSSLKKFIKTNLKYLKNEK